MSSRTNDLLFLFILCALVACQSPEGSSEEKRIQKKDSVAIQETDLLPPLRPATQPDTLMIEGMPEPVELRLYQSPEHWPISFHTYLPPGLQTKVLSAGEGDAVRFSFNEASITHFTLPQGSSRSQAQALAMAALGGKAKACERDWPWQWGCFYSSENPDRVARVLLGEQHNRYFYFLIQFPAEYADGFSPRYHMVLKHFTMN